MVLNFLNFSTLSQFFIVKIFHRHCTYFIVLCYLVGVSNKISYVSAKGYSDTEIQFIISSSNL